MTSPLRRMSRALPTAFVACALMSMGCADLTKVDAPDFVQPASLANQNGAITMFYGSVKSFYSATGSFYIRFTVLFSDETTLANATSSSIGGLDIRSVPEGGGTLFSSLLTNRILQQQTIALLQEAAPTQRWRIGQVFAQLGYLELLVGESFCSGVPLGSLASDFSPVYGPPLTTSQVYQQALATLDSALLYATDSARIMNLARLGRGRALLNLNQPAAAAAAVTDVPTSFQWVLEHSAATAANNVAIDFVAGGLGTVADREGLNGLNFVSANDPRVPLVLVGKGGDGTTNVYRPTRISSNASPNILTTGAEARLIEAEAALRAGDVTGWLGKLNNLRVTGISPAMTALADPGTPDGRVDLTFRERAFWLFLTGHRFGDLRRLVRQYGRAQNTVFPTGPYKYGGSYGSDVTSHIDPTEIQLNPLMGGKGCIDRNA